MSTIPTEEKDHDGDGDPETDTNVPLPDEWAITFLQAMRLRYVQRQSLHRCSFSLLTFLLEAFDPDASAFTTISEINAFTDGRPAGWR